MVVNSDVAPFVAKGKTMLSASEMKAFEKGTAVDVRGSEMVRDILRGIVASLCLSIGRLWNLY